MADSTSTQWYALGAEEALDGLGSSRSGLGPDEARRRLEAYGPNAIGGRPAPTTLALLAHQIRDPMIYLLLGAAVVTLVLGEIVDAVVIGLAVGFNTVVGFVQESRAEKAVAALAELVAAKGVVVRGGLCFEVDPAEIVPGDLVVLESGARVPADLRLIEVHAAAIDESLLTGESTPVQKTVTAIGSETATPLGISEQLNMAFAGTVVTSGRALGVVVATGVETRLGQISDEVRGIQRAATPLQNQLGGFSRLIGAVSTGVGALVFAIGIIGGEGFSFMVRLAAAVLVAAIPEGLPVMVTVTLAVGVTRMARRRAVIRRLVAAETLGSVTAIASDKTGTLTENQMTVERIYAGGIHYDVEGAGYSPEGAITTAGEKAEAPPGSPLYALLLTGLLCSDARLIREGRTGKGLRRDEVLRWRVEGDPTEGALVVSAAKAGLDAEEERRRFRRVSEIPFSPESSYMATLNDVPPDCPPFSQGRNGEKDGTLVAFVKGAPERVVGFCDSELRVGGVAKIDEAEALRRADELASGGLRVLALAYKIVDPSTAELTESDVESGLCLLGFQGSLDPPRPEAMEAIEGARHSGIKVYMVTGDHQATARAIAEMLGIVEGPGAPVRTGRDLARMSAEDYADAIETVRVFARVEPEQKLALVRALQAKGEVVAVTGDGVNDAPALKQANIGVAMGQTGTDVAKEAADVVITDDNFATIYSAVLGGRAIYENIRKAVLFLIPTALGLTIAAIAGVLTREPLPFRPAQIIWINLVTNALQTMAVALEPAEPGLDSRRPRNPKEPLFNWKMARRTLVVGSILAAGTLLVFRRSAESGSVKYAESLAVTTMVLFQNFHLFNSRSLDLSIFRIRFFSNPFLFGAVGTALAVHVVALYWGPLQSVLGFVPLSATGWLTAIGVGSTVLIAVETLKWFGYIFRGRGWGTR